MCHPKISYAFYMCCYSLYNPSNERKEPKNITKEAKSRQNTQQLKKKKKNQNRNENTIRIEHWTMLLNPKHTLYMVCIELSAKEKKQEGQQQKENIRFAIVNMLPCCRVALSKFIRFTLLRIVLDFSSYRQKDSILRGYETCVLHYASCREWNVYCAYTIYI